jgi:hypothetical protein
MTYRQVIVTACGAASSSACRPRVGSFGKAHLHERALDELRVKGIG